MRERYEDEGDYQEYLELQREASREDAIDRFNRPVGKWAPADFVYQPRSGE